ncbi:MAG: exodeoxyribonuclease V subunit alpha [Bacteroidetes bacterium]|nr:exodeoxyribonuclease V subunit alpha [Bacteroidota bacterium]
MENFARSLSTLLRRLEPSAGTELEDAVLALASGLDEGHVCADIRLDETVRRAIPSLRKMRQIVGYPGEYKPLVLDGDRLYLGRYWHYEHVVESALRRLSRRADTQVDAGRLHDCLQRVFPEGLENNDQAFAALGAAVRNLTIISGGPGTGKTTTVSRILALKLMLRPPGARYVIKLAAPTGKAADRLREAIGRAKAGMDLSGEEKHLIPEEAFTIHRLLGIRDNSGRPARNAENPVHADLVVLDEASMIDLSLMTRIVEALPPEAGLILLGDKDQLDAVQPGSVFGELCGEHGYSAWFLSLAENVLGERRTAAGGQGGLSDSLFILGKSYRFGEDKGIGRLARAVTGGDDDEAIRILRSDTSGELVWDERIEKTPGYFPEKAVAAWLRPYFALVSSRAPEGECFQALNRFRLLTPLRDGVGSVQSLNDRVEQWLRQEGFVEGEQLWYPGKPVMVGENNYTLNLYNGDVGITMADRGGSLRVVFPGEAGTFREFPPARLPVHDLAYATTVHKSQGSEFDEVLLILPEGESPVMTRNLLYTGITRARKRCTILGTEAMVRAGIRRKPRRMSGLGEKLQLT